MDTKVPFKDQPTIVQILITVALSIYPIIGEGTTGQTGSTCFDENGVPL